MPFLFKVSGSWAEEPISPFCLDGFLKHAAFEEGIANQKRLKAPLKQFQRISSLDNNSAVFTAMPKYRTSVTSNVSTQAFFFFTMHTCQQTVTAKCFQLRLDLLLPLKKKKTLKERNLRSPARMIPTFVALHEQMRVVRPKPVVSFCQREKEKQKDKERRRHENRGAVSFASGVPSLCTQDTYERPTGTDSCPSTPPLKV